MKKELLLIRDYLPFNFNLKEINESITKNNGKLIVKGVLQRANAKNQNGRVYPRPILEREATKYIQTEIAGRRALGELDHPESSVVNLRNVSHNILEMHWDGDDLCGTIEILNTPSGNILKELFKANVNVGISSRAMGSTKQIDEDTSEVEDDLQMIAWDFVSNPSTHGAFMKPVNESVEVKKENKKYIKADELIHEVICKLSGVCCISNKGK